MKILKNNNQTIVMDGVTMSITNEEVKKCQIYPDVIPSSFPDRALIEEIHLHNIPIMDTKSEFFLDSKNDCIGSKIEFKGYICYFISADCKVMYIDHMVKKDAIDQVASFGIYTFIAPVTEESIKQVVSIVNETLKLNPGSRCTIYSNNGHPNITVGQSN